MRTSADARFPSKADVHALSSAPVSIAAAEIISDCPDCDLDEQAIASIEELPKEGTCYGGVGLSRRAVSNVHFRPILDIAREGNGVQYARMRWVATIAVMAGLLSSAAAARPEASQLSAEHEVIRSYETSEQGSDGSSGSSSGRTTIIERLIEVRETGLELEYDLPNDATAEDRAREWQFPVRVFRPSVGPMELLNRGQLEARLERWLKAAGWDRRVCGRWIFTWNAFRIECDPEAVIKTVEAFDLRLADIREGAPFRSTEALGSAPLVKKAAGPNGATFEVTMKLDPDVVRRSRAEVDVVAGEILQKPVTLDAALRARSKEIISGTVTVTIETDLTGNAWRRIKVVRTETVRSDGGIDRETATETVERPRGSAVSAQR